MQNSFLRISPQALSKIYSQTKVFPHIESMWLGEVRRYSDTGYYLDDIHFPPQAGNSGAHCETDDERYPQWAFEHKDKMFKLRAHGHSHCNMSVSPSVTDVNMLNQLSKTTDYFVQVIVNNSLNIYAKMQDEKNNTQMLMPVIQLMPFAIAILVNGKCSILFTKVVKPIINNVNYVQYLAGTKSLTYNKNTHRYSYSDEYITITEQDDLIFIDEKIAEQEMKGAIKIHEPVKTFGIFQSRYGDDRDYYNRYWGDRVPRGYPIDKTWNTDD